MPQNIRFSHLIVFQGPAMNADGDLKCIFCTICSLVALDYKLTVLKNMLNKSKMIFLMTHKNSHVARNCTT